MDEQDRDDHYSMILEWEPQGACYVVTVPELPGCRTHGKTLEEAVRQARDLIESWVDWAREDGEQLPPPKHYDLDGPNPPDWIGGSTE